MTPMNRPTITAALAALAGLLTIAAAPLAADTLVERTFNDGDPDALAFSETIALSHQGEVARDGWALQAVYTPVAGAPTGFALPLADTGVAGARTINFWLRSSQDVALYVALGENPEPGQPEGSRYGTLIFSPADTWQQVELSLDRLRLSDDTTDDNGRLDAGDVPYIAFMDVTNGDPNVPVDGERTLWLDELTVVTDEAPSAYSPDGELPYVLETSAAELVQWLPLVGEIERNAETGALEWYYDGVAVPGEVPVLMHPVGHLPATGAGSLELTVQSERLVQLVVMLQEENKDDRDESNYIAIVQVPATDEPTVVTVFLDEFNLADDSRDENGQLDLDQVSVIILSDLDVLMQQGFENLFSILELKLMD